MQTFYHRFTRHAIAAIESCNENNSADLKTASAFSLIPAISRQKGSLGRLLLKNSSLAEKIEKNKNKIEVTVFEVLIKAFKLASANASHYIGTEHLIQGLLAILAEKQERFSKKTFFSDEAGGIDEDCRQENGKIFDFMRQPLPPEFFGEINAMINNFLSSGEQKISGHSLLKNFCIDLNNFVKEQNHILVGRTTELERISNILGRKMKNNPVLIGDPGVGKTAIVEGLAQKINEGKAPFYLNNKKIYTLDLGLLVAGTNFRGEFESRLKEVISEAKRDKNIILFIDELHNLVGAGGAVGGMDAANLLKPALSRGEIQIIGATTFDEYHKHIDKDAALERRFQPIVIGEPSREEALEILKGIKKSYESYHNIIIDDDALKAAVLLAKTYLINRFLPDSAIDLIDESSAKIRAGATNQSIYHRLQNKEAALEELVNRKKSLVLNDQYEEAIRLRKIENKIREEIKIFKTELSKAEKNKKIHLTAKDIQKTLSDSVHIPADYFLKESQDIPNQVRKNLKKNLFGQDDVIEKVYNALLRQFSGITNPDRPLGSFLFIGPSGVGKTQTAKIISAALSPLSKDNLIQINMSEFMERHSVSRLLGAPAGYVGYEEGGELLDKVRHNPYSVVLFDEIEKADQNVLNILLQILDEGKITNAKGQPVNFKNAIIILTSNIGNARLNEVSKIGFEHGQQKAQEKLHLIKDNIQKELEEALPLELINRLDDVLIFSHLTDKDIRQIAKKELEDLKKIIVFQGFNLIFDGKIENLIAKLSLDPQQGARLVRKQIKDRLEPLIAKEMIKKRKEKVKDIKITAKHNKFAIQK